MSLQKKAISGFFWTGLEQFGTQAVSLVVSILLARILLPSDFGLIGMIIIFVALGKSLMDSGLSQSLIRTKNPEHIDFTTVFYFNLAGSIIIYGLVFLIAPLIAAFYDHPLLVSILRWYALVFVLNALGNIQQVRIIKNLQFKLLFRISIPAILIGGIVGVCMAYFNYGVWSLVLSALTQAFVQAILFWLFGKWKPAFSFSKEKLKTHFSYGYKLTLSGIIDVIYKNIFAVIIGKFFSINQLGYYTRADTLKQVPVQNVGAILNKVTFPLFTEIQDDNEQLKQAYKKIMKTVLVFITPILLFSAVLAEPLFRFVLTEKWLPAVPYYQILCWAGILYPINAYNLNILKVKGRSDLFLKLEIIKKTLGVLIVIVTVSYGIIPLLLGSVFTAFVAFFVNSYYTGKFIEYTTWQQLKDIVPIVLIALVSAFGIWSLDAFVMDYLHSDLFRILGIGFIGLILYVILMRLLLPKVLQETMNNIKHT